MSRRRLWLATLALGVLALSRAPALAQGVGSKMPATVELDGFTQTQAKSWDDLLGRAVFIEFFAFW
jgi:hypothetical protein